MNKKTLAISSCTPVKILIDSADTYFPIFTNINSSIKDGTFPEELKLAELTPLIKKADPFFTKQTTNQYVFFQRF